MRAIRIPAPGETISGHSLVHGSGGKGANQAVSAARLGADVTMIGAVGDDPAGRDQLSNLAANGVHTDGVIVCSEPTGLATVMVTDDGENSIIVIPGANGTIGGDRSEAVSYLLHGDAVFLAQLELPTAAVLAGLRSARVAGAYTILNAAPMTDMAGLLGYIDLLIVNETEADILARSMPALSDPPRHRPALAQAIASEIDAAVIITLGGAGAVLASLTAAGQINVLTVPADPVEAIDTTGAGDTFVGALAARLTGQTGAIDHDRIVEAMRLAVRAAAIACTRVGAQTAMPTLRELQTTTGVV